MTRYEKMRQGKRKVEEKILHVGAYCRVSTDKNDQANSFESQQRYFREYIERQPNWELIEIFADEGKSGTSTKKRTAFNHMIDAAKRGKLDLIITKEISRFARNTLDSIYYTRELKRLGVGVIFLNDNINTLDPDAELRLTIMSSIAQEESRKISDRVKWGQRRRMEQGVVFGRDMLGYDINNGVMTLNADGAKIVRLIFHKFVTERKGCHTIARELREAGIQTSTHMKEWSNTVILRIIRNEKYCGDLVQKKTFTPDYLSHEKKYNRGEEEFVIIHDHHEPIISREIFDLANAMLDSRAMSPENKTKISNRYLFSGKIKCGICGATYVARYKKRADGSVYKSWRCLNAQRYGAPRIDPAGNHIGCSGQGFPENDALYIVKLLMKSLNINRKLIRENTTKSISSIAPGTESAIDALISGDTSDDDFYREFLSRLVITNRDRVDVILNLLPFCWSYNSGASSPRG
ncbi:MAG: recombinase family protein [Oscillospiraceae bacterium]|nr:recombinase family protein [Oscillospiraceae bacterium]